MTSLCIYYPLISDGEEKILSVTPARRTEVRLLFQLALHNEISPQNPKILKQQYKSMLHSLTSTENF